jgi:tRNA threonylcarbamoyl adenosine modification protein (Sua5/YciO/YrdC/YwlC family)
VIATERAIAALRKGQVVAIPTDTVYGLAASLDHPEAIDAIFALKHRPETTALPVLVESFQQLASLGVTGLEDIAALTTVWWPGDVTVILPCPAELAHLVHGTRPSLAVRIPGDEVALGLLSETGPLAATSANIHGEPTPVDPAAIDLLFSGDPRFAGTVDAGPRTERPSAIVDATTHPWSVLRQGRLSDEQVKAIENQG